jgi:hypothetical protein
MSLVGRVAGTGYNCTAGIPGRRLASFLVPSRVATVFAAAGLDQEGVVAWGQPLPNNRSGVYVVATGQEPDSLDRMLAQAPISGAAIEELLAVRPELTLDGQRPTADELASRIAAFWLPDEPIVYIGLATSLRTRVRSFYRTPLGAARPHSGGWFLKTLANLDGLYVHFAPAVDFDAAEIAMLDAFVAGVSRATRTRLADPDHPWPFANLEIRQGGRKIRKRHGIKGARGDLRTARM